MKSVSHMSDAQLVRQARIGSQDAFAQLYHSYVQQLFYFARQRTNSDQDAADIVQATFLAAFVKLSELRNPSSFRSWIFSIALTKITDDVRVAARQRVDADLEEGVLAASTEEAFVGAQEAPLPEDVLEQQEAQSTLLGYLNKLTPLQKDVLILRYYADFKPSAIAQLLGQSKTAIYKRLHDATAALRSALELGEANVTLTEAVAVMASSRNAESTIAHLVRKDEALRKASANAERLVTPKLQVSLSALIAGGTLTGEMGASAQALLQGLERSAGLTAGPRVISPSRRFIESTGGKVATGAAAAGILVAAVFGGRAVLTNPEPPAENRPVASQPVPAPTPTEPSASAAPQATEPEPQEQGAQPEVVADSQVTAAPKPQTLDESNQNETPEVKPAPKPEPKPEPQPEPEPQTKPVLTVAQASLSYNLGAELSSTQIIADSGAKAHDGAGKTLELSVTGLENVNTEHTGSYLVFIQAPGAAVKTIEVTLHE
jgi:RNA polymerase sigma-70 factor (ECF subfamily)